MILNETVVKIADAIREKTGKSDPIAPINFAEEIKSISAGGGASQYKYYRLPKKESSDEGLDGMWMVFVLASSITRIEAEDGVSIMPTGMLITKQDALGTIVSVGFDTQIRIVNGGISMTVGDVIQNQNIDSLFTPITEAEFYDLNA